jgi:hypothetical protein
MYLPERHSLAAASAGFDTSAIATNGSLSIWGFWRDYECCRSPYVGTRSYRFWIPTSPGRACCSAHDANRTLLRPEGRERGAIALLVAGHGSDGPPAGQPGVELRLVLDAGHPVAGHQAVGSFHLPDRCQA